MGEGKCTDYEDFLEELKESPCYGCKYYEREEPIECKSCSRGWYKGDSDNFS